jgi:acyl carrier protein
MADSAAARSSSPVASKERHWQDAVCELAEARLRQLVAERLGIDAAELGADVALASDLGADEVDLLEIAAALEEEFGLVVSDAMLGRLRTYGDLSASLAQLLANFAESDAEERLPSGIVRVRIIRQTPEGCGALVRAARLTPRVTESIVDDILRTGGVVRLELTCSAHTSNHQLACVAQRLALLRTRGVQVIVQRTPQCAEMGGGTARHAAGDTLSRPLAPHTPDDADSVACRRGIGFAE